MATSGWFAVDANHPSRRIIPHTGWFKQEQFEWRSKDFGKRSLPGRQIDLIGRTLQQGVPCGVIETGKGEAGSVSQHVLGIVAERLA